jgi:hypothetical protein
MNKVNLGHALRLCLHLPDVVSEGILSMLFHNVFDFMPQAVVHSRRKEILLHPYSIKFTVIVDPILMFC